MQDAEPLQQVQRTYVRYRGRKLLYFGGCDYFRLASHPKVLSALRRGVEDFGLNVAASRTTTGNSRAYDELESDLARFLGAETALLTTSGYVTNLIAAQAFAGHFSHALIDASAHAALQDAAAALNCPVMEYAHCDPVDFHRVVQRCGSGARLITLTDGLFSRNGQVAPLRDYQKIMPRDAWLLVDDAHGIGTIGANGGGAVDLVGASRRNLIQCLTLSKALGCFGGAIACSRKVRTQLLTSRMFIGSTPLPPPLAAASRTALQLLQTHSNWRTRLAKNATRFRTALREAGFNVQDLPGPIVSLAFENRQRIRQVCGALLQARILPPLIHYPGAPALGYFRFVISSEHTPRHLKQLATALAPFAG